MASISRIVNQVKALGASCIEPALVQRACRAAGYVWRQRMLGPVETLQLFMLQVLDGNIACRAVSLLAERMFTPQAYCDARMRLPVDVIGHVAAELLHDARQRTADFGRWLGHRVFHIDGTGLSMPDTAALLEKYGRPQPPGKPGFPVMHVLWLFDAATGLICDFIDGPWNTHDMAHAAKLHDAMQPDDVLVGDRAFGSFAHLALLLQAKLHGVFRQHQRRTPAPAPGKRSSRRRGKAKRKGASMSRRIASLGRHDHLVEYVKPKQRPTWMSEEDYARLPGSITVRELRYRIPRRGYRTTEVTLVTTLLDPRKYSNRALAELYRQRWDIETNLRHLKQTMGMDVLHCTTVAGVHKELWMHLIVYNQVRLTMLAAATRQRVRPDRISFIDALDALRQSRGAAVTTVLTVNPLRPGRHQPRAIKRRKDRYSHMTRPREKLRQELGITHIAA